MTRSLLIPVGNMFSLKNVPLSFVVALVTFLFIGSALCIADDETSNPDSVLSYANDIEPIFRAHCWGCHQPARASGGYVMNEFERLIGVGDSEEKAIIPGDSANSYLVQLITPDDSGHAAMPEGQASLSQEQIAAIRQWIDGGAENDGWERPLSYSSENPPIYHHQPLITTLDHSSDGKWIAASGYHEVLLLDRSSLNVERRFVGVSPRIESVKFSPDGTRLAVSGGTPGVSGEIQVWDFMSGELLLSKTVSHDTAFGVSWSPDSKLLAFGLVDTTIRAISAETGEQVLFQGAHDDWVRDTVFSVDGTRLVSVGRDTTCKLTELATERFIDNITSITPAILKGGISSVARHPDRDEIVVGCADGVPKIYRLDRQTKRVIGDDANLVRRFPAMQGRIEGVDVSSRGTRFVAVSSLDGRGTVAVYSYEFDSGLPEDIKAIMRKVAASRNAAERKKVEEYVTKDVRRVASVDIPTALYSVSFSPDGSTVAVGGADGVIRCLDSETGAIVLERSPFEIVPQTKDDSIVDWTLPTLPRGNAPQEDGEWKRLKVQPEQLRFGSRVDYAQMLVQATDADGVVRDVTHLAQYESESEVQIDSTGFVQLTRPQAAIEHRSNVSIQFGGHKVTIPLEIQTSATWEPDFIQDVNPMMTRMGCNAGTCHGSQAGKNGFKLSLRGYDPIYDLRALKGELASRRVDRAGPRTSLALAKPAGWVPHEGGPLLANHNKYRQILKQWIEEGADLDLSSPRVATIDVEPKNPVLQSSGKTQQIRVVATYTDKTQRDVTREAFIESSDLEIVTVKDSRLQAVRRGEAAVVVRYDGAFTATTVTVMGARDGYEWVSTDAHNRIDELVAEKWKRMKILPSDLCSDTEFIRRVYLDLTGLPPSSNQVKSFVESQQPQREKREALVDQLIGNPDFVEFWTNKWADLLQVNRKYLGVEGSTKFRDWIRTQVDQNLGYDQFVHKIITASGSNYENPAASYYKILRTPEDTMENTTHLFLGTRFNCNKCHDHPFERWTQDQYYETAAYFAQFQLDRDPTSGKKRIGGSAVESAKPLYEKISDVTDRQMKHERTQEVVQPKFPFDCDYERGENLSRREEFAAWLTSRDNPYFATSYVNRLWGYLMGVGLIEPLDDLRASNPPTNPQLLAYLTQEFLAHDFDSRHIMKLICTSRTYQLSFKTNHFNSDDQVNYSHAQPRRLPAEVLFDAIHFVTGSPAKIPGVAEGTRAAMLSDAGARLPSGFLTTLGRPARESACECERSSELQLGSVLALVSGPDVARAISNPKNAIADLVGDIDDDATLIDALYLRILNRPATKVETDIALEMFALIDDDHQTLKRQREERKKEVQLALPGLESQRQALLEKTSRELAEAIAQLQPDLLDKERLQREAVAKAAKELSAYQKDEVTAFESWSAKQQQAIGWQPLLIHRFQSSAKRSHVLRADRSVLVGTKKTGKDVYTVDATLDGAGITAVRLEVLADQALPHQGPGLAENGNFVLTEFTMEIAHPDAPNQWKPVKFSKAESYFSQGGYPIERARDGKPADGSGWATMGRIGVSNWACFSVELPVGYAGGSLVRFKLHQNYDDRHQIGCFRIAVTNYPGPVGVSVDELLATKISKPFEQLDGKTKKTVQDLIQRDDPQLKHLQQLVADAKKPLKVLPQIVTLREKRDRAAAPLKPDPLLTQLDRDWKQSQQQSNNRRLTAAQDLTWALINSPSFLFNR